MDCVKREVFEETGLRIADPVLCGVKSWENPDGSRYIVLLFRAGSAASGCCKAAAGRKPPAVSPPNSARTRAAGAKGSRDHALSPAAVPGL
ncbi:MAG TPA: hypothetical protein H9694_05175 [Firmicutes bacterium]|nr:hypothetical protein [Bacillota bacterium]